MTVIPRKHGAVNEYVIDKLLIWGLISSTDAAHVEVQLPRRITDYIFLVFLGHAGVWVDLETKDWPGG